MNARGLKADCTAQMRNEVEHSDIFILSADETAAWHEYGDLLTEDQRRACFKAATAERAQAARIADHVDGYDRDDIGESPDY